MSVSACWDAAEGRDPAPPIPPPLDPRHQLAQIRGKDIRQASQARPRSGSVTQGSDVNAGVTTDLVNVRFIPGKHEPYYPIATIRTATGETLTSHDNPDTTLVNLPDGRIITYDDDNPPEEKLPSFHMVAEGEINKFFGDEIYYSEEFEQRYPDYYRSMEEGDRSDDPSTPSQQDLDTISLKNYFTHPNPTRRIDQLSAPGWLGGGSYTWDEDFSGSGFPPTKQVGNPREMYVFGYTDYPSAQSGETPDTDYLSWGVWVHYDTTYVQMGAFADGLETSFPQIPVTGTATYAGFSSGFASKGAVTAQDVRNPQIPGFQFIGKADLTANLGTGTVTGTVTDFKPTFVDYEVTPRAIIREAAGANGFLEGLTINLGGANVRQENGHSFFEGDAHTADIPGESATGKWGGQFFGTPETGQSPPAVGGTWGVSQGTGANAWQMIGGYGAWKTN